MSTRRVGVASGLVVALAATSLTFFAVTSKGETVHETELSDGGVWVSSAKDARFARVNKAVGQFDGGVVASSGPGEPVDILQDDNAVAGLVVGSGSFTPIEPKSGRLSDSSGVFVHSPRVATNQRVFVPGTVDLRGGTVAKIAPSTGKVWGQAYDPKVGLVSLQGLVDGAKRLATVGAVSALAVDVEGNIHAVSGATGKVVTIPRTPAGFGKPVTEQIKLKDAKVVDITAVGTRWVVYSAGDDKLFFQGSDKAVDAGTTREEGKPAYAALQQPGPDADTVGLQDSTTLRLIGSEGTTGEGGVEVSIGDNETPPLPSRPLRSGSCIHAAWASEVNNYYGKDCGGSDQPQPAVSIVRTTKEAVRAGVSLRTNHGLIVLNDLDGGEVWDLDSKPKKLDEWDSLIPPPKTTKDTKKKDENLIDETSVAQPPTAKDDNLKARPGRTSKLHVLDNDTDAAGSVLAISPEDLSRPDMEGVTASVAADGQSIDVSVPDNPERQSFSFTYKINNGKAPQKSQAKVTVTLVPDEVNSPPTLRPGTANLSKTVYPVIRGKLLPVQVIGDWRDPESDSLSLEAVAEGSSVDGLGRLNVLAPMKDGTQGVAYSVNDGRVGARGTVTMKVLGADDELVKPKTQPDVVRGVVGKPLQLEPLGNDIPGADPTEPDARMRLSRALQSTGALAVDTNLDTGVVTVTGTSPGTFSLSYGAQVGGGISAGQIRIDLIADPDPDAPPVAVPDAATLRDQTPVLSDVLANDYSPRADVLVTRSVSVAADSTWLRPSIYQGRWVRIEALEPAGQSSRPRTGTVTYTISDGVKTTTGEVNVSQFPANSRNVPVVGDDQAVVRAQDTATVPVMDNDSMADGIPLVLDPASVKVIDGAGYAFASGNVVRFVPKHRSPTAQETVTVEYAVYPIGDRKKATTGRITIAVMPLPTTGSPNQPPVARSFSTSVTAGDPLTITVPTSGVDPDGDSVTVAGLVGQEGGAVDLRFGRVTGFGPSTIRYEAYPTAAGTEVLNYEVRDRFGATSQGFVRIGVVQPGDPQPPVAVEDEVRAKPGKTVTVDATQNDLIARGDSIELEYKAPLNPADELSKWKVDEANTYFTTKVPAPQAGVQHLTYGISNGLFDPSRSTISVVPDPNAKNPPVAVDDTAKPKQGETTTLVDALANDRDVDGTRESLKISAVLSPEDATVEGNQVRVKVKPFPYTVPYVITDEDGLTAMALIYVPTGESGLPFVVSGALIEMDKDSTKAVKLSDYVKSPRARVVSITTAENVSASPRDRLRVEADGRSGLRLTSSGGYIGPGAVMLEVSDQETVSQKDFKTAYVSIPVQIGPKIPLLRCPSYTVKLNAGGRPRTIDVPTLCHAWVPVGMTLDDVVFESSWRPQPKDVDLRTSGAGDRLIELKAGNRAPSSINGRLVVKARGGPESTIAVSVFGIDGGQVDANGNPLPSLGPPRLRPFSVSGLEAGSSRTINLRAYLDSPLETPGCTISAASAAPGSGLTVTRSGCDLTLTASASARGRTTVDVSVADGPGRNASGRGTVEILGKPDAPTAVAAEADRVSGGFARVRWLPPDVDGGSPITGYVVVVKGPGGREVNCSASPCTITDLQNGESYRFAVIAVNAIGRSPASNDSNAVVPDTLPNPVNGVRMEGRGDGSLTIAWTAPAKKGSDVTTYEVRVTDTSTGAIRSATVSAPATRTTVAGLTNDDEQSVQVRAKNKLGYGPFGSAVRMQSAGTPPAVPAPRVDNAGTGPAEGSSRLTISWDAVRPNGPALTKYTVYESREGGAWSAIGTTSPDQRQLGHTTVYDGASYRYVVTATNGADLEGNKANPTTFSSIGIPEVPGRPNVTTPSPNLSATVRVSVGDSRSGSFTQLQWRNSNGRTDKVSCGCPEGSVRQWTITNMGTDSQTLQVRAFNGTNWSDWSPPSNTYRPYTTTKTPANLNGTRNNNRISWTWTFPDSGRDVDQMGLQVGTNEPSFGSVITPVSPTTSYSLTGKPGYYYEIRVRAHTPNGGGWSSWTRWERVSIPDPPVTKVTVLKGDSCPAGGCHTASGSCTSSACHYISVRSENLSGGANCHFQANGRDVGGWNDMSIGANQTKQSINYYGFPGGTVSVNCGGHRDSMTW
ncbi:Fibronectin type III domain-containing protein [Pedococcus dokdonensis]|uniref:Fibronectin type III domain-containing protein n=1 Tax=Pedococcus dokdonensis TaxID=443156 RepID=A0A1H0TH76_9MICO|nr:fibronectin type III domain-containing protein [Pedococcus dokdonensis]SDP53195.1 Fibronectin type III domain-containing protein [Pedococcus dokdonensis]